MMIIFIYLFIHSIIYHLNNLSVAPEVQLISWSPFPCHNQHEHFQSAGLPFLKLVHMVASPSAEVPAVCESK